MYIVRGNKRWDGSWFIEGSTMFVVSAEGSRTARVGDEPDRAAKAKALLADIVDVWAARKTGSLGDENPNT